jgi:prepilin-type N-terminal cleavage/methylation domain-containing protein
MNRKGVTLIELMIALVISATLVAAIYRTFLTQQHTYTVQDDVVDMQQNVRVAINEVMREIRMAGFGNVQSILPVTINVTTYNNVINPDTPSAGALTVLAATRGSTTLIDSNNYNNALNQNQITVHSLNDSKVPTRVLFDKVDHKYISIAGSECYTITDISGTTLTLDRNVVSSFRVDVLDKVNGTENGPTKVYAIRAVTYLVPPGTAVLRWNENFGGGNQPLADNIENITFQYLDSNGNPTVNPANFRTIRVTVTARTENEDPQLKAGAGDGYRRRQVASNIFLRNMGL